MEFDPIQIATQTGGLGLFVWYVWHANKEARRERERNNEMWVKYLQERNGKMEKAIGEFDQTLKSVRDLHERQSNILVRYLDDKAKDELLMK